jgi:hypothetical protein
VVSRYLLAFLLTFGASLPASGQAKPERFDEEATLVKSCTFERPSLRLTLQIYRYRGQLWYAEGPNAVSPIDATSDNVCVRLAPKFL